MAEKWDDVWAEIRPHDPLDEGFMIPVPPGHTRFHIEVNKDGQHYWSTQNLWNPDIEAIPEMEKWVMDELVKQIEYYIDRYERTGKHE